MNRATRYGKGVYGAFQKSSAPFHPSNMLEGGMSLEDIATTKGMNFGIGEMPAGMFINNQFEPLEGKKILYRDDTNTPLSVVGDNYKPVSPIEMLSFFDDIYQVGGYKMVAAGCLKGGTRYWSIAETNFDAELPGGDKTSRFIFLGTAIDGSLATTGFAFDQRYSCWNMSPALLANAAKYIKVPHSRTFNPELVREQFALVGDSFKDYVTEANFMASRRLTGREAMRYFASVLTDDIKEIVWHKADDEQLEEAINRPVVQKAISLYAGEGLGSKLESAKGTLWGAYNAVTELLDHHKHAKSEDNTFYNNTMGTGFNTKHQAWNNAQVLMSL